MTDIPRLPDKPADHPQVKEPKVGVLLVNLGTPSALTYGAVRRYLEEFLNDRRVIELPRLVWWPILYLFVLTFRPARTKRAYASMWDYERDESPIRTHTREQAALLQERLGEDVHVDWAMRYGEPAIRHRLQAMKDAGCNRILLVPLYPQYAAATTATVVDEANRSLAKMRWQPSLRVAPPFFEQERFLEAIAGSIENHLSGLDWNPEEIVLSYHGLPKSYLLKGDPYHCQCVKTTRLVRDRLATSLRDKVRMTFQSRFGPEEWLQPYTDKTLEALAEDGTKRLAIAAPSFVSDCVETLEELAQEGRDDFMKAGGEQFTYIPCLNASEAMLDVLQTICHYELAGWVDVPASESPAKRERPAVAAA
jgi:ferrochelatase